MLNCDAHLPSWLPLQLFWLDCQRRLSSWLSWFWVKYFIEDVEVTKLWDLFSITGRVVTNLFLWRFKFELLES